MWRTGQHVGVPLPQVMEVSTVERTDGLPVCGDGAEGSDVGVHGEQVKVAVGEVVVELAAPCGEDRSFGLGVCDRTSTAATVAKPVVEARPPGFAKNSASTESVCAVSPGDAGSSWSRAGVTTSGRNHKVGC